MELDLLAHRLSAGLVRVAVAAAATDELERTLGQQQALLLLSRRERVYSLAELAEALAMPVAVTQSAVATLVREGLVEMGPSPSYTPYEVCVALTDSGRARAPEFLGWADALLGEFDRLDELDQRGLLARVVTEILALQAAGRIPVTRMCLTCRYFEGYAHPGSAEPHHCWYVDAPFGSRDLRVRCPEQAPRPADGPD